jgi:hypothetical protein
VEVGYSSYQHFVNSEILVCFIKWSGSDTKIIHKVIHNEVVRLCVSYLGGYDWDDDMKLRKIVVVCG